MTKRITLFLVMILIIFVMAIAAALPQLDLQPGQPLPVPNPGTPQPALEEQRPAPSITTLNFFKGLVTLLFILFLPVLVYGLIKKSAWRQIFRSMTLITLVLVAVISLLILLANMNGKPADPIPDPISATLAAPMETSPIGSPPDWLIWLIFALLALLVGGIGIWVIYTSTHKAGESNLLAEEAEKAMDALKAGMDLKNVILRCYLQMSLALQQEQGIEREEAMTPREFERLLEAKGIPHEPVHELTRLFEAVRYGRRETGEQEEKSAFACLNAIIQYSRAEGQPR